MEVNERKETRALNPKGMMLCLDRFTLRRITSYTPIRFENGYHYPSDLPKPPYPPARCTRKSP